MCIWGNYNIQTTKWTDQKLEPKTICVRKHDSVTEDNVTYYYNSILCYADHACPDGEESLVECPEAFAFHRLQQTVYGGPVQQPSVNTQAHNLL